MTEPKGMDALVWARAFMERFGERRDEIDEGLMLGWFANAIMTGYDTGRQKPNPCHAALLAAAREVIAQSVPLYVFLGGAEQMAHKKLRAAVEACEEK